MHTDQAGEDAGWLPIPLLIIGLAFVVRLLVLLQLGNHPLLQPRGVLDDAAYAQLAMRVASGDLLLALDIYFLAPFYTYFLGLILAATNSSLAAARMVQVLLGTAAVVLTMWTATAWYGRRAGWIAGIIAAGTGLFAFNEILILQSAIDPFLTALALFALTCAVRSLSLRGFLFAGLSMGALILNRPNALPCAAAAALIWMILVRSRTALYQAILFLAGVACLVGVVAARNRLVGGEWVLLTSHGGLNFYIGNNETAGGTWQQLPGITPSVAGQARDMRQVASQALHHPVSSNEASDYYYQLAWQWVRQHPAAWLKLLLRKTELMLTATDVSLNYSYTYFARDESSLLTLLIIGPWFITPLGLFGLALGLSRQQPAAYLTWVAFVPVYALSVIAFFVSSRYRLAWLVPLVAGSGNALAWLWSRFRQRSRRALFIGLAVVVLLAAGVNWPIVADNGRLYQRCERIVQLMSDGQAEQGRRLLAETEDQLPDKGLLFYRIGLVLRQRGDAAEAVSYLERSLPLSGGDPNVAFNLGEVLLELDRPAEALPHLRSAREASIERDRIAVDMVAAHLALGQNQEARELIGGFPITRETDAAILLDLGQAALRLEEPGSAEPFLRAAVARRPNLAQAHKSLGLALAMMRRNSESIDQFRQSIALEPGDARTLFYLGLALAQDQQIDGAIEQLRLALRLQPDLKEAQGLLHQLSPK